MQVTFFLFLCYSVPKRTRKRTLKIVPASLKNSQKACGRCGGSGKTYERSWASSFSTERTKLYTIIMEFSEGKKTSRNLYGFEKKDPGTEQTVQDTTQTQVLFTFYLSTRQHHKLGHIIFNSYTSTYKNSNSNDSYNSLESMWSQEITSVKPIFSFTGDVENSSFSCPECY